MANPVIEQAVMDGKIKYFKADGSRITYAKSGPSLEDGIRNGHKSAENLDLSSLRTHLKMLTGQMGEVIAILNRQTPEQVIEKIAFAIASAIAAMPPPQITVNVPEQPAPVINVAPAQVTVTPPQIQIDVHTPEQKEYDIEPVRDEKTGLAKRFKRVPKEKK